jgi:muramoyltetrapeptide carboxypeptidase
MHAPYLKVGDTIAIVATARHVDQNIILPAVKIFESWGLKVVLSDSIYERKDALAGSDQIRSMAFQKLLDDESIKAIIGARGGYGTVRMIDLLDFSHFSKNPKWLCGFSDITVLHSHIQNNFTIQTLHSCMPVTMGLDAKSDDSLKEALFGSSINYSFQIHTLNRNADCEGTVIGGNLSVLCSILGSKSDMDWGNKILFIEDVGEYYYHIDRMMQGLDRAGKFKNLKGILVGGMSDMNENAAPFVFNKNCYQIINEVVGTYNFPVFYGFPAGHENLNLCVKLAANCKISFDKEYVFFFQE